MTSPRKRPWPVLFLCSVLLFNAFGMSFGMGAIFTDIMDTFGVPRATAALVQSLCTGFLFGCGIVTSQVLQRQGPRVAVITGSVVATAGCVIAFLASHIVQVIVGIGVLAGFGISCCFLTSKSLAGLLFHDIKSLALTICSVSEAAGIILYPQLFRYLVKGYSLRGTFLILAAINCQMILCGALIGLFTIQIPGKNAVILESGEEEEAEAAEEVAAGDKNGNPRKSGDGGEDCRCSLKESSVGEIVTRERSGTDSNGALPCVVTVCQDDYKLVNASEDIHCDDVENNSAPECRGESEPELPQEERKRLMSDNQEQDQNQEFTEGNDIAKEASPLKLRSFENPENRRADLNCCQKSCCSLLDRLRNSSYFHLDILRDRRYVVISLLGSTAYLFYTQPMIFMTDMVKSNHMTVDDGSMFLTIMFVGNVVARVMAGLLYRLLKSGILFAHSIYIAVGGVTCLFYLYTTEYHHFMAVSFFFGTGSGFLSACAPINVLEILGPGRYSAGLGYLTTVSGVSLVLSGPVGGLIRDQTNSYEPLYYIACVQGLVLGSLLFYTAWRYRPRS